MALRDKHKSQNIRTSTAELLHSFKLDPEQVPLVGEAARQEFLRRLPDFMKISAIAALLPEIQERVLRSFIRKGTLSLAECEDLAGIVVQRIFESLCGRWPRRNVSIWVNTIAKNELSLHFRKKAREEKAIGRRARSVDLDTDINRAHESGELERLLIELPDKLRALFDRRHAGEDWATIEAELEISEAAAGELLDEFQRPFAVSSGRRKKSRRKRS